MKTIKLKVNSLKPDSDNYVADYLLNLGIASENLTSFLEQPKMLDEDDPWKLTNMAEAVQVGYQAFSHPESNHIFVQVDSDTDGYTSSSILINYLKRKFPTLVVKYRLHEGKEHGVIVDTVPEDCNIVIIPDAGSNQFDEHKALIEQGKTVIILDHHEVDGFIERPNLILVNNQTSINFSNKYMSGAGVVYMFIRAMDEQYFSEDKIYTDYRDLAAIGIIADAMNMTSLGNNFLAYYGLSNIHSQFIRELALRQARGIKDPEHLTKIGVAFYIAPLINGVIRSGSKEDKEMVIRAMTEENNTEIFNSEWRGKIRNETLYQLAARLASNAKSRQDAAKKKAFEWLCEKIEKNNWDKDNLIIATMDEKESNKVDPKFTGLVAMELVKKYNKPCLVLRKTIYDDKEVYGGSGRNGSFYGLESLLDFLHQSNLAYYAEGHGNAFGCFLLPEQVQPLRDYANKNINSQIFDDTVFEVDYWFHTGETINQNMLFDFASYDGLYGNSIPQPKFAFDFAITSSDYQIMGADKSSLSINHDGIKFVAFKCRDIINQIEISNIKTQPLHVQIVGRPQLNEWMGRVSVQVMIDDIEITDSFIENPKKINLLDLI